MEFWVAGQRQLRAATTKPKVSKAVGIELPYFEQQIDEMPHTGLLPAYSSQAIIGMFFQVAWQCKLGRTASLTHGISESARPK